MGLKLNKWQRAGIILSVIAFVGLALQAWVFQARQRDQFYNIQLSLCEDTLRTENELAQNVGKQEDLAKREATNQTEYESCKAEAAELLRTSFDSSYKTMLLHARFVLVRCVLNHLRVRRERMKRGQDRQHSDSGTNPLGQRNAVLDSFPGEFRPVCGY